MGDSVAAFANIIDAKRVLAPNAIAARATSYWNTAPMRAGALVMPATTQEVTAVLEHCYSKGQSLITQGGLTNCVSAVEPVADDVVLSTEKMAGIVEIDRVGGTVVVEAGAVLQNVQEAVAAEGLFFPLDLGARGSCTIGGTIATNAGGINVLRYGMMRNLVLGLETVLADGTVISSLNRMLKNNAGYDTKQLFIGSEGSLGVVTRAVLRLFPQPATRQNGLVAMDSFDKLTAFLSYLQKHLASTLSAFEVMWNDYYADVTTEGHHRPPLSRDYPFYAVFQVEGSDASVDEPRFERVLEEAFEQGLIVDAVVPKSETEARAIWDVREGIEPILRHTPVYLYDVGLPIRDMESYINEVYRRVRKHWPNSFTATLGHIADGNLHVFVSPGEEGDHHHVANECVYDPLKPFGGSISAEHGIGMEKLHWLPHSRSAADIALMRSLKHTLDPKGILNPNRVLPPES